ncbi:Uncharacterised protein [Mycobacteroides abscessus subsp. abscessus]|nr:Uncharacterised protein [Mycobacteroides abscessus subsp. abscessus]
MATCNPTTKARYGVPESESPCVTSCCHEPPIHAGTSTEWPRLDTGNSSVTPCRAPMTMAWV